MPVPRTRSARRLALLLPLAVIVGLLFASQASAHLYWGDYDNGIGRANEDGSEATPNFIPVGRTWDVAVGGSHIYWSNEATDAIGRANLDGTGVEPAIVTGLGDPTSLVVYGNKLYWDEYGGGSIGRANLDGSEAEPDFIPKVEPYFGIAAAAGHLYWSGFEGDDITRAKIDGTDVEKEFIKPTSLAYTLVADGDYIYWGTETSNEIGRARLDGSEVQPGLITGITAPIAMTADAGHLYFAEFKGGSPIARAKLDGTDVEPEFITGPEAAFGLAVDPARPTLTNAASAPITLGGGALSDTVTVAGGDGPTGTLTFSLHGPQDPTCSGAPLLTATAAVGGDGSFTSPTFTPTEAGTYRWTASYVGLVGHAEAASACAEPSAATVVSPPTPVVVPKGFTTTLLRGRNKKKGSAKVLVQVQAAGTIKVSGPGIKTQTRQAGAAGGYRLPVVPRGAYLKHLVKHRRGFTRIAVAFTPDGTEPPPAVALRVRLTRKAVAGSH
jgi:virginiamycin B lyase